MMDNNSQGEGSCNYDTAIASVLQKEKNNDAKFTPEATNYREKLERLFVIWEKELDRDEARFNREVRRARHQQDIADREADRGMRQSYALKVYIYLCCYSVFAAFIILFQGFSSWTSSTQNGGWAFFHISETSLSLLIGSTAVSAIGLVAIVLRGLFSSPK